jgi:LemA protein
MEITAVILIIVIVLVVWAIYTYNRLVVFRNRAKEAWADIDVQLKRRYDLIPNLIETVKGYASHEKEVFENVTKARANALSAEETGDPKEVGEAENQLTETLKSLFAVSENYPDLKASNNFIELQKEIRDTEDKIQASRRFYNRNVLALNTKIETFPVNVIAGTLNFKKREFFEIENEQEKENVKVSF